MQDRKNYVTVEFLFFAIFELHHYYSGNHNLLRGPILQNIAILHLTRQNLHAILHGLWSAECIKLEVVPLLCRPQLSGRILPPQCVVDSQEIGNAVAIFHQLLGDGNHAMDDRGKLSVRGEVQAIANIDNSMAWTRFDKLPLAGGTRQYLETRLLGEKKCE